MTTNEDIFDSVIRHQVWTERYKASTIKKLRPILDDVADSVKSKISRLPEGPAKARLEKVLVEIIHINKSMVKKIVKNLGKEMTDFSKFEAEFMKGLIENQLPEGIAISIGLPTAQTLHRIVHTEPFQGFVLEKWAKTIGAANAERARRQLYIGIAEGESIPNITRRFDFIANQTKNDMETVIRTSVNHVSNAVKDSVYKANDDVISGVQWRSTLDGRTSPICRSRDGEVYDVNKPHPTPPAHPRCRSTIIPVVKSFAELGFNAKDLPKGTRSSMNGQVPSDITYDKWLRRQPRAFVDEVLGKKRAKLFLGNKVSMDQFVDFKGRLVTLDELKTIES